MHLTQQPAYVLHARLYRETSLLLECLTRDHGRLGVVARGVRGQRARIQRSDLEPFQLLSLDLTVRGELATLRMAESLSVSTPLHGDALLCGLYVNELIVRLSARQDPYPSLFDAYGRTLQGLAAAGHSASWVLRRFERDLLQTLGYALQLQADTQGIALDPEQSYLYVPEQGAQPCPASMPRAVRGADLLALASDHAPDADGLRRLRRMMREVLAFHLDGRPLRAWRMLQGLPGRA
jgi:DNA repair protein RecO (recombination protein O)